MTRREPAVAYSHMLAHAREALTLTQGKRRVDLDSDRLLNLALVRLMEIIGEAANQVPQEEQRLYSQIPWTQIISLRNRLIHGYDAVDFDILWQIITWDLPPLVAILETIVPPEERD